MMIDSKRWKNKIPFVFTVQLICLLIMGIVEFLNITKGYPLPISLNLLTNAGIVLSLFGLWTITLLKSPRSILQRDVIMGIVMVLWFLIVELNRRINHTPLQSLTLFVAVYLIALPFASIVHDQERQFGIRLVSGFYIAAAFLLLTLGLVLFVGGKFSGQLSGKVYWDGARLLVISHPNITSRTFMIALALSMGFFGQSSKIWIKTLSLISAILLFAGIALTNTRAVVVVICFILAGNAFFLVYKNNRKHFLPGIIAAIAVAIIAFTSSNALFEWNIVRLTNQPAMPTVQEQMADDFALQISSQEVLSSGETIIIDEKMPLEDRPKGNANSGQGSLLSDLPTLNNRTHIWAAVFQKIWNEPMILLRGVIDTRLVLGNLHTHNAWLEALFVLGLPGLLLVLIFTWNAAWSSLRLLCHSSVGMFQKNIALLTLATMVAALLEPSLFVTYLEWSFSDFFFFLCLGYLTCWSKQISNKK